MEKSPAYLPAELQIARLYRHIRAQAEYFVLLGGQEAEAGLRLYDSERHNIAAGHALAASAASQSEMAELVRDYPLVGPNVLALRQNARERIAWLKAACAAARQLGAPGAEATYLAKLGSAYRPGGQTRRSIHYYKLSLHIAQINGDRAAEARALSNIGLRMPIRATRWSRSCITSGT